jgi:hypothetical protein
VFADFDGDGRDDAVVFYNSRQNPPLVATVLVLKGTDDGFKPFWSWNFYYAMGFAAPSGVTRFGGRPVLVANVQIGAMAQEFQAFRYENGGFRPAGPGVGMPLGDFEDLDHDGRVELVARRPHADLSDIYAWDGSQFTCANSEHPAFYRAQLGSILTELNSAKPLMAYLRAMKAREAMEIYLYEDRAQDAVAVAQAALTALDNGLLTQSNYVVKPNEMVQQLDFRRKNDELEKSQAKADIYQALAVALQVAGKATEAEQAFQKFDQLLPKDWEPMPPLGNPRPGCSIIALTKF